MTTSIIITTNNEPKTLLQSLEAIKNNILNSPQNFEIIIVGPDQNTKEIVKKWRKQNKQLRVKLLKDKGIGKPNALNFAIKKTRGYIVVLTDGDVFIGKNSLNLLLSHFHNPQTGLVSGQPISLNNKNGLFGFWSHFLVSQAHKQRSKALKKGKYFPASGYLYAFRKQLFTRFDKNILSEDAFLSRQIWEKKYRLIYEPEAKVCVKFPTNWPDWLRQKKRSVGGYIQKTDKQKRLSKELAGWRSIVSYPNSLKEYVWMFLLVLARLYLWLIIFWEIKILRKSVWERVESTK